MDLSKTTASDYPTAAWAKPNLPEQVNPHLPLDLQVDARSTASEHAKYFHAASATASFFFQNAASGLSDACTVRWGRVRCGSGG
jgi:hypothetical protein